MKYSLSALLFVLVVSCGRRAQPYDFPSPVDTTDHPITEQVKRSYAFDAGRLTFDNQFDGARLNNLERLNDSTYVATILPENSPINPSPWYAMRIVSDRDRELTVRLAYPAGTRHRYFPKLSRDREAWIPVGSSRLTYNADSTGLSVRLAVEEGESYLAGQEIVSSRDVMDWMASFRQPYVRTEEVGRSTHGRPIPVMRLSAENRYAKRPMIVLFSRQHPPEVTGYLALQAFVEGIVDHPRIGEFLERYQLMIFPILNPDGVDMGHWRHTAGGIDSNRDWAYYHQPEARQVADYVVKKARQNEAQVILGMDFHSTWHDVYYTFDEDTPPSVLPEFKDAWLRGIEERIGDGFEVNESPGPVGRPTSSGWFKTQFNAEGITYEIGDDTDRDFVERKGKASANAMIDLLLDRD
ncbi:M14 family metallopeptidase [Lewinella sp. JB7]|uniref:M14 family metallopeptidase n=1 Tax=Lewinella sp. JB7 TaxID=2962887 RepID=UPI0020C9B139|nr:M14 family metallopeptidase [Lewinella sp. JB7]MCP9234883.1 M14 family metallopeptidase [Lewinella sp. JB7]